MTLTKPCPLCDSDMSWMETNGKSWICTKCGHLVHEEEK